MHVQVGLPPPPPSKAWFLQGWTPAANPPAWMAPNGPNTIPTIKTLIVQGIASPHPSLDTSGKRGDASRHPSGLWRKRTLSWMIQGFRDIIRACMHACIHASITSHTIASHYISHITWLHYNALHIHTQHVRITTTRIDQQWAYESKPLH